MACAAPRFFGFSPDSEGVLGVLSFLRLSGGCWEEPQAEDQPPEKKQYESPQHDKGRIHFDPYILDIVLGIRMVEAILNP
jgi:hypothetical protein